VRRRYDYAARGVGERLGPLPAWMAPVPCAPAAPEQAIVNEYLL